MLTCPSDNTIGVEEDSFWDSLKDGHLEPHQIGWIISGACTVATVLITLYSVLTHMTHYHAPTEQRQIIRILYLPPIFGIISFFSYRYFREYYYYSLVEIIYEAVTISAFMLLIIEFVATTASGDKVENAIARKDKKSLPLPLCFWRYRPTKPYFMYTIKWSVMQYVIIRPAVSIAGIITNALGLYCESGGYSFHFAYGYLEAVDAISITIALYGLFVFYTLTRQELKGKRPLAKFMAIKLIVFATFYQGFVFSILSKTGTIKATTYWTVDNVANGLSALCLTIEMVFFSVFMIWAYPVSEYKPRGVGTTSIWKPLIDSVNYADFAVEIWGSLVFFVRYILGRPGTHSEASSPYAHGGTPDDSDDIKLFRPPARKDFASAFQLYDHHHYPQSQPYAPTQPMDLNMPPPRNPSRMEVPRGSLDRPLIDRNGDGYEMSRPSGGEDLRTQY